MKANKVEKQTNVGLTPCPFCGSSNISTGGDDKVVGAWCTDCQASGPNHYNSKAEWNTRAEAQPQVAASAVEVVRRIVGGNIPMEQHQTFMENIALVEQYATSKKQPAPAVSPTAESAAEEIQSSCVSYQPNMKTGLNDYEGFNAPKAAAIIQQAIDADEPTQQDGWQKMWGELKRIINATCEPLTKEPAKEINRQAVLREMARLEKLYAPLAQPQAPLD